jgi:chemotaxis protein methyltransferase CheR
MQSRYFHKVGSGWQIDETIRKMVDFRQFNLAEPEFSSYLNFNRNLDVIFCRNVLMYFSPALIRLVGLNFYNALRPQGWFITSPVELSDELFAEFIKVQFNKSIVYRKTSHKQLPYSYKATDKPIRSALLLKNKKPFPDKPQKNNQSGKIAEVDPIEIARRLFRKGQYAECAVMCQSEMSKPGYKHDWHRLFTKSCANMGHLDRALEGCREMLSYNRLDADTYYLMATILTEKQELTEAVRVLNQGFYINPDHLMSHLLMAGILRRLGNSTATAIHQKNIKRILAGMEDHVILDETEGLTVGRIIEMVELQ